MSDSIFDCSRRPRTSIWEPPVAKLAPAAQPARTVPPPANDAVLMTILESPLHPGETAYLGFARKEGELRDALSKLTVLEARALQARLANPRSGDLLAAAFARLTADRRARLINFLADARRREALGARAGKEPLK